MVPRFFVFRKIFPLQEYNNLFAFSFFMFQFSNCGEIYIHTITVLPFFWFTVQWYQYIGIVVPPSPQAVSRTLHHPVLKLFSYKAFVCFFYLQFFSTLGPYFYRLSEEGILTVYEFIHLTSVLILDFCALDLSAATQALYNCLIMQALKLRKYPLCFQFANILFILFLSLDKQWVLNFCCPFFCCPFGNG